MVGVVGAGHLSGMRREWEQDQTRSPEEAQRLYHDLQRYPHEPEGLATERAEGAETAGGGTRTGASNGDGSRRGRGFDDFVISEEDLRQVEVWYSSSTLPMKCNDVLRCFRGLLFLLLYIFLIRYSTYIYLRWSLKLHLFNASHVNTTST